MNFLPKSNLRPVLWSHRSPWGIHKSQKMLTTALCLMPNDVKDPVYAQAVADTKSENSGLEEVVYSASCPQQPGHIALCVRKKWLRRGSL